MQYIYTNLSAEKILGKPIIQICQKYQGSTQYLLLCIFNLKSFINPFKSKFKSNLQTNYYYWITPDFKIYFKIIKPITIDLNIDFKII